MKIEGFNYDLAVDALASIEMDRDGHDQTDWAQARAPMELFDHTDVADGFTPSLPPTLNVEETCHTAKCMAGWALTEAGVQLDWEIDDWSRDTVYLTCNRTKAGMPIEMAAQAALGGPLPLNETEDLVAMFEVSNTVEDLYEYVADYAGRSIEDVNLDVKRTIEDRLTNPTP